MLQFGDFVLDPGTARLSRAGTPIALQSQPSRLLVLLVRRPGEVVTRDEIRAYLWGETIVSADQNINYCIRQIRIALGDADELLQTVPRHGYRFTGSVRDVSRQTADAEPGVRVRRPRAAAAPLLLALLAGVALGVAARDGAVAQWRFVHVHLTEPLRCPFIRFLIPNQRNS